MARLAIALTLLTALLQPGCSSRCREGFQDIEGECVGPDGSVLGRCDVAPAGFYAGLTDQGLEVSFRLSEARDAVRDFAIDTQLTGPEARSVQHQIRWAPGFNMVGCEFIGTAPGAQFSASFVPPASFAGIWADSFSPDLTTYFTGGGTFTASFQGADDGGASDGGEPGDGGAAADGGVADGGAEDGGGIGDGGAAGAPGLVLPAGFTSDVYASDLSSPSALASDPTTGDLFVAQYFAGSVIRIARGGARSSVLGGLSGPLGLSFVPGGPSRLYASHAGGIAFLEMGGSSGTFGPTLPFAPGPLLCDATPRCFVAELELGERGRSVWAVTAGNVGTVAAAADGIDQPFGLGLEGDILVVAEASLGFASADGVLFHNVGIDGGVSALTPLPLVAQPGALARLRSNLFFVSEVELSGGHSRQVFLLDRDTRSTRSFAQGFSVPFSLAYDADRSELFVADLSRGIVYRIRGPMGDL